MRVLTQLHTTGSLIKESMEVVNTGVMVWDWKDSWHGCLTDTLFATLVFTHVSQEDVLHKQFTQLILTYA